MSPQDTRTLLLETALNLIWSSNYNAVGVNEICKQAGVTKGSFYHHFESKAELFFEATNHYWDGIKQDLDSLLSPINSPLEQLENWIAFILANKLGEDADNIPGCAFFNASTQIGCCDEKVNEALRLMLQRGRIYNTALVRALQSGNYLEEKADPERLARLLQQYVQGASSYARINRNLEDMRRDLPEGVYRILGLKAQYWFTTKPTWSKAPANDE